MQIIRIALFMTGALIFATPALADRGGRDDDDHRGKHEKQEKHGKKNKRDWHESFDDDDRLRVHDYYSRHRHHVPPGLAKKGGVPPGLAKKGEVLEERHQQMLLPVPPDLEKLLPPPPHEVIRRIIGRDMVLIHKQTHKVLDVLHDAVP